MKYSDLKDVYTTGIFKNLLQDFSKYGNQYGGGFATKISLKASSEKFENEAYLIRQQNGH